MAGENGKDISGEALCVTGLLIVGGREEGIFSMCDVRFPADGRSAFWMEDGSGDGDGDGSLCNDVDCCSSYCNGDVGD